MHDCDTRSRGFSAERPGGARQVGAHIGRTAQQTREVVRSAHGGVLFVDEAYTLVKKDAEKDFGTEAVEELMRGMDGGEVCMVFAGYERKMREFMESNAGLYRRVAKQFTFVDYTAAELAQIAQLQIDAMRFTCAADTTPGALTKVIASAPPEMRSLMNGGVADQLVKLAKECLDGRLPKNCDAAALCNFQLADMKGAMAKMTRQWAERKT